MDGCNARRDSARRVCAPMWLDRTIWVIWIWAEIWMLLYDMTLWMLFPIYSGLTCDRSHVHTFLSPIF